MNGKTNGLLEIPKRLRTHAHVVKVFILAIRLALYYDNPSSFRCEVWTRRLNAKRLKQSADEFQEFQVFI
jgi:hypothetical protein